MGGGGGLAAEACVKALHAAVENQLSICDLNRFSRNAHGSRSQEWLLYMHDLFKLCNTLCIDRLAKFQQKSTLALDLTFLKVGGYSASSLRP